MIYGILSAETVLMGDPSELAEEKETMKLYLRMGE
jgi:hypothetical protein